MRDLLAGAAAPVAAVSPFVAGEVVKGPTEKFMRAAGHEPSIAGVADAYEGVIDGLVVDADDPVPRPGRRADHAPAHADGLVRAARIGRPRRPRLGAEPGRLMRATAVLPVKRFAAAKERLGDALAPAERAGARAGDARRRARGARPRGATREDDRRHRRTGRPSGGRGARRGVDRRPRRLRAFRGRDDRRPCRACGPGEAAVALLPGDCPLVDSAELDRALADLARGSALVVPDRHGTGTNGLLLCPPDAIEPSFGPDSRDRHLDLARRAGVEAEGDGALLAGARPRHPGRLPGASRARARRSPTGRRRRRRRCGGIGPPAMSGARRGDPRRGPPRDRRGRAARVA